MSEELRYCEKLMLLLYWAMITGTLILQRRQYYVNGSLTWLSLGTHNTFHAASEINVNTLCDRRSTATGLVRRQRAMLCRHQTNNELLVAVQRAASLTLSECRHQFVSDIWNCPLVGDFNMTSSTAMAAAANQLMTTLSQLHKSGSRESAFVHALSSASVTHTVTEHCNSGKLANCECDGAVIYYNSPSAGGAASRSTSHFQWTGCTDNINYSLKVSQEFVDAVGKLQHADTATAAIRRQTNLHNNNLGRKITTAARQVQCKCHGVSGSCDVRTCWRQLTNFRSVSDVIKRLYQSAVRLGVSGRNHVRAMATAQPGQLIYTKASRDHCRPDNALGIPQMRGRVCGDLSSGDDSLCRHMCCGRGYVIKQHTVVDNKCRCRFKFCCYVKCDVCQHTVQLFVCR